MATTARSIEVRSGRRVHALEAGDGPPVVCLHGSSTSSVSLLPLLDRAHGLRLIAVDRPGLRSQRARARPPRALPGRRRRVRRRGPRRARAGGVRAGRPVDGGNLGALVRARAPRPGPTPGAHRLGAAAAGHAGPDAAAGARHPGRRRPARPRATEHADDSPPHGVDGRARNDRPPSGPPRGPGGGGPGSDRVGHEPRRDPSGHLATGIPALGADPDRDAAAPDRADAADLGRPRSGRVGRGGARDGGGRGRRDARGAPGRARPVPGSPGARVRGPLRLRAPVGRRLDERLDPSAGRGKPEPREQLVGEQRRSPRRGRARWSRIDTARSADSA